MKKAGKVSKRTIPKRKKKRKMLRKVKRGERAESEIEQKAKVTMRLSKRTAALMTMSFLEAIKLEKGDKETERVHFTVRKFFQASRLSSSPRLQAIAANNPNQAGRLAKFMIKKAN